MEPDPARSVNKSQIKKKQCKLSMVGAMCFYVFYVLLRSAVWCCVVLCGAVWCCVVLCSAVWCCVALCGVVWCCGVLCGVVCCYVMFYDVV